MEARCRAFAKTGLQCRNKSLKDKDVCGIHNGTVRRDHNRAYKFEDASPLVLKLLEAGHTQGTAATLAGVDPSTVTGWNNRGRQAIKAGFYDDPYAQWYLARQKSRHKAQGLVEDALFLAATRDGNVTAMLAWLKRRAPDDWGDLTQTLKVEGEVIAPYARASTEELRTGLAAALTRANALVTTGGC